MSIRTLAILLVPALLLAACNTTPTQGPGGPTSPTFSGNLDNGDD